MTRASGRPNRVQLPAWRDWLKRSGLRGSLRITRLAGVPGEIAPASWDEIDATLRETALATVRAIRPKLALGPAALHRLTLAIVEAAESGLLPVGESWRIDLEDPTGVVEHAAGGVLDTVAAIDQLWGTNVMPPELTIGSVTWSAASGRYKPTQSTSSRPPDLTVILDPYTPPHGQLPTGTQPTVVVRSAFLPVQPSWRKPDSEEKQHHSKQRRNITSGALTEGALRCLLEDLYGHPGFRERQLETVIQCMIKATDCIFRPFS
jgi:hypothetical protein